MVNDLVEPMTIRDDELLTLVMMALDEQAGDIAPDYWQPQAGPQAAAFESDADIIGYGGAAGGGKSDLLMGLASMKHKRSIIFRRVFPSLRGLIERSREIFNAEKFPHSTDSFNESLHVWRLAGERMIEFGAVQHEKDRKKHQGQPRDFFGFDEATEFPESIIRFLIGWNRTTTPGQKCQVALTFNPPMDDEGQWVVKFFAPWLDKDHPLPAADGELRWFAMLDGQETEIEGGEPFEANGQTIQPKSRTFFHASLKDNPILESTGYGATIDALPEPLRSLLRGNFDAAKVENPFQVIPSAWIRAAIERGKDKALTGDYTALGVDIARGGRDKTVIAPRIGRDIAPLFKYPGSSTPDGQTVTGLIVNIMRGSPVVNMDVIGIGASAYDYGKEFFRAEPINFAEGTTHTDKSRRMKFGNVRAAAYWRVRELLDPDGGFDICLPDDKELISDLTAPRWELRPGGKIYIESKDDIIDRLGRSPDCGDAVVLAYWGNDPLPKDTLGKVNPSAPSKFTRPSVDSGQLTGSRWRR